MIFFGFVGVWAKRALLGYELLLFLGSILFVYLLRDWTNVLVSIQSPWVLGPPMIFLVEVLGLFTGLNAFNPVSWLVWASYFDSQASADMDLTRRSEVSSAVVLANNSAGSSENYEKRDFVRRLGDRLRRDRSD